jgi:hypothetical protein
MLRARAAFEVRNRKWLFTALRYRLWALFPIHEPKRPDSGVELRPLLLHLRGHDPVQAVRRVFVFLFPTRLRRDTPALHITLGADDCMEGISHLIWIKRDIGLGVVDGWVSWQRPKGATLALPAELRCHSRETKESLSETQ